MGEYHITGGIKLSGEVEIGGAKNAVLPILAATVLNSGVSVIHNCPKITDTFITIKILEALGCKVKFEGSTIIVDSSIVNSSEVPENLVSEMRSSIIFLGGLLGKFGKVKISYPGGCELGLRPIDLHIKGLRELGAKIDDERGFLVCSVDKLRGADISLDFPSVGATENIMLAGVLADGVTKISNAAKEPEIVDLQIFLNACGADITGAGSDTIVIRGVKKLHDAEHYIVPDRIVAGTFLVAAAITNGSVTVKNIVYEHLDSIIGRLRETGCILKADGANLRLQAPGKLKPISKLRTHPHPGFPTDMQAQTMALLCLADGTSVINETVFESRNKHIGELIRMGADIILSPEGTGFIIKGIQHFDPATVEARDLRGGAALILAGLSAQGKTIVKNSKHVERGYEKIENSLSLLGAKIEYVSK